MQERYKQIRKLGEGATAQVYLVEEITTGKRYAMKVSDIRKNKQSRFPKIKRV